MYPKSDTSGVSVDVDRSRRTGAVASRKAEDRFFLAAGVFNEWSVLHCLKDPNVCCMPCHDHHRERKTVFFEWPLVVHRWRGFQSRGMTGNPIRSREAAMYRSDCRFRPGCLRIAEPVHVLALSARELTGTNALRAQDYRPLPGTVQKCWDGYCGHQQQGLLLQIVHRTVEVPMVLKVLSSAEVPQMQCVQFVDKAIYIPVAWADPDRHGPDSAEKQRDRSCSTLTNWSFSLLWRMFRHRFASRRQSVEIPSDPNDARRPDV